MYVAGWGRTFLFLLRPPVCAAAVALDILPSLLSCDEGCSASFRVRRRPVGGISAGVILSFYFYEMWGDRRMLPTIWQENVATWLRKSKQSLFVNGQVFVGGWEGANLRCEYSERCMYSVPDLRW